MGDFLRKTKIVATLGPATYHGRVIADMIKAGLDVARLNFSHQTHAQHKAAADTVKHERERLGRHTALMLDTKGPEIRVGGLESTLELKSGDEVELVPAKRARFGRIPVLYPDLLKAVKTGDRVLINDGLVSMTVEAVTLSEALCRVTAGGTVAQNKGVNLPDSQYRLPFLGEKDRDDIRFAAANGFDFIAASFVSCAEDIEAIKALLRSLKAENIKVIAKIESKRSVENIEGIIAASDGVMIARGDLGTELDYTAVPKLQKSIIAKAYSSGKPAITATQMLESMTFNPRPTRAEVSDVANSIFDGTSAVMLSGETAAGKHPVEAVAAMSAIALATESGIDYGGRLCFDSLSYHAEPESALSAAACVAAAQARAKAVVALTNSEITAALIAARRVQCGIVTVSSDKGVLRHNSLNWGVHGLYAPEKVRSGERLALAAAAVGAIAGDRLVVIEAMGGGKSSASLKVVTL